MLLKCLKCGNKLDVTPEKCACPQCASEWPIVGGIPRFFHVPNYYWGEVGRNEAQELLNAARKQPWAEAVQARFPDGDNMIFGLLDLQRASWVPMLGLDDRSVALDIGCGYGAITHSISRSVGELYSVEAIPERIEFTQERLRQEGIHNVQLIQASAMALPLVENSFDLVVTNGVLEWVGEWDLQDGPRDVQLRFLGTIRRLLKEDGVLVIGIENRFGYGLFLGGNDHSGISYTSLVPRRMASFMLRRSSVPHHRTQLNARREYRTYTYSERGYLKLLTDAGFADVSCRWAEPGYNQPYNLIPLGMPKWVQEQFLNGLDHPGPLPPRSWRRSLKRALVHSRLLPLVLPDFVLFASKREDRSTKLQQWLRERLEQYWKRDGCPTAPGMTTWELHTNAFEPKSIVRIGDVKSGQDVAFLKIAIGTPNSTSDLEVELANLVKIRDSLQISPSQAIAVPQILGSFRVANTLYCLESAARGTKLSRMVRRLGYFSDPRRAENDFAQIVECVIDLTKVLTNVAGARAIDSSWRDLPEQFKLSSEMRASIEAARYFGGSHAGSDTAWIQHGDLSVENIFLDLQAGRIEVLDWADMANGFPPLYDLFSLFYSTGYLHVTEEAMIFTSEEERWIATFNAVFASNTGFGQTVAKLILNACERLNVRTELIPALLVEFLLVRSHYFVRKSLVQQRILQRLLHICVKHNLRVFGRFQIGHPSPV